MKGFLKRCKSWTNHFSVWIIGGLALAEQQFSLIAVYLGDRADLVLFVIMLINLGLREKTARKASYVHD